MKLQVSRDMMRRCSLLLAFLFCIDHVACLDGVSIHNWSTLFNNQPSKNWVVLVAGSNTWENYRHQADVFHAYQVVRKNNVPPENIITFAYDDIANNPRNPFKGQVFNDYNHLDVYRDVVIDYRGKDVTRDNFVKVLKGNNTPEANKKLMKSGPDDNVFIFFSGLGTTSYIAFLGGYLYAMELHDALAYVHSKKKFNKLVLYVEACKSGSMFKDMIDVCLANEYSYEWITDSERNDIKKRTLNEQYTAVKRKTLLGHVMQYGDRLGHIVKETIRDIVMDVTTHHKPTIKGLSKRDELMCFRAVFDQFRTHCFTIQQASCPRDAFINSQCIHPGPHVPEVSQHTDHLMQLCKAGYNPEILIESVHNFCS
ncbi:hypothetical protein T265_11945 [Opisthorchis viverrini]|uniref:Peptidase C13 family protein n=1 Tax=Opisthorchis viverrini TaxID=6198 RepID=A0A074ZVM2_OPIVI|nr:hypothetical protein T265_11945 [Opisthorchis viverrini]KER19199.1 hypothetical protein T265_11945 [Opisthorchis viverrini]